MGSIDSLYNKIDNVLLCAFAMKDGYCVMMLMFAYGTHDRVGDKKISTIGGDMIGIKYTGTVHIYYHHIYDMVFTPRKVPRACSEQFCDNLLVGPHIFCSPS